MNILAKIKKAINDFLKDIAEANRKSFGGKPPRCCDLNKSSNNKKAS